MKIINILLKTVFISAIVFCFITFLTYNNDLQVDGCKSYGFPFRFYEVCADLSPDFINGFKMKYLLLDISIISITVYLFLMLLFKKRGTAIKD